MHFILSLFLFNVLEILYHWKEDPRKIFLGWTLTKKYKNKTEELDETPCITHK